MRKFLNKYFIGILILTSLVYSNSIKNEFVVNWSEDQYQINDDFNRDLSLKSIEQLFLNTEVYNYHPITTIFNALEYKYFVTYKYGAHLLNLLLHLLVIIFFYRLLLYLNIPKEASLFGTALFALHPIHVEAVSWVAESKFSLIALFYLITILFYILFILKGQKKMYLGLSYFSYFIGLFIHPIFFLMPFILFLLDYFYSRKIAKGFFYEKLPFMLTSLLYVYFVFRSAVLSNDYTQIYSLTDRIFIGCYSVVFYIYKFLWPFKLLAIYGRPLVENGLLPVKYYLAPIIILVFGILIYKAKEYRKVLVFGGSFYLLNVLYFSQIFPIEVPLISERHSYIGNMGLILVLSYMLYELWNVKIKNSTNLKLVFVIFLSLYFVFCSAATWNRNKAWLNDISLFTDVIKKNPTAGAYWSRANSKSLRGDRKGAIDDYTSAIGFQGNFFKAYFNRAVQKTIIEDYNGAIADYTEALKLAPNEYDIFLNRGRLKMVLDNDSGALEDFTEALYLNPEFTEAYYFRGVAKYNLADDNGSISDYNEAISLKPDYAEAYYNRGNAKYNLKDFKGASNDYSTSIQYKPNYAEAYFNRAIQNIIFQDTLAAIKDYTSAIQYNPQYANAYGARGILNLRYNKEAACQDFQMAKQLGLGAATQMLMQNCQ